MFFNKSKNKIEEYEEKPLGYWEEESYMIVIPENNIKELVETATKRIADIEGVKIIKSDELTNNKPGKIKLSYENEKYEIGYYPSEFAVPEMYINKNYIFKEEEKNKLKNKQATLTIFMKFSENSKKSYHLQLKVALAMIPNLIAIMDESAEKLIPASWIKMAVNSKVIPSSNDLFTVQAVNNDKKEVWLHTHGLCRCGLTELEILQSNEDYYNSHYNLITTFANHLIDQKEKHKNTAFIGMLSNRQPVVATYVSWTQGIKEYEKLDLGSIQDRQNGHNSKTSIIFLYKSEEDEKQGKYTKVSEFNNLWEDNPIFLLSNEETARMKELAVERFNFVKEQAKNKENKIIIKIGLPIKDKSDCEHIWFELIEFKEDKFKAKLIQESYNIENMHEGDEKWFTIDDVTDWLIYTPKFSVNPSNAYVLI